MTYLECGSCGALLLVQDGQDPALIAREHNENADHTRPGA